MDYSSDISIDEPVITQSINSNSSNEDKDPIKLFHLFMETNNLREARKLIRKYKEIQRLNPKELNKQYPMKDYRFTSRSGILTLDSIKALNNKVTFEKSQIDFNNEIDEFKSSQRVINNQLLEKIRELEYKNKMLIDKLNEYGSVINQIVAVINGEYNKRL